MARAVVLGGGGPVGIGWEAGLLVGLKEAGVDAALADAVVGTSAGSVVGFTLASGGDLTQAVSLIGAAGVDDTAAEPPVTAGADAAGGLEALMASLAEAARHPERAEGVRARLGSLALGTTTITEEQWLGMFASFAGQAWPAGFSCTAVDTATGTFRVWDGDAGVEPQQAIASSCAVPAIFPPVTIGGTRWMDGGVRDMLNVDVAAGHEAVLVVSCTLLDLPEGFSTPVMEAVFSATRASVGTLRDGGTRVEVVVPGAEMLEISGWGLNLMDFTRAAAAYQAGRRQGVEEASRIAGIWG
jgi:NTE family protein